MHHRRLSGDGRDQPSGALRVSPVPPAAQQRAALSTHQRASWGFGATSLEGLGLLLELRHDTPKAGGSLWVQKWVSPQIR
jgi:hypothetical protein